MTLQQIRQTYEAAGQGHVFEFFDSLSASQQSEFLKTLQGIDVQRVNRIFKTSTAPKDASAKDMLSPLPEAAFDSLLTADKAKIQTWEELGLKAIAKNQVGIILLAGGQGTRLGSSAPKGCYDIQLPSHKSLFQLQAERISRLQVVFFNGFYYNDLSPKKAKTRKHYA
jgi:UDP-N-acetylglucosamine/UDP-N-acetylgalactosamine diphosphorylase